MNNLVKQVLEWYSANLIVGETKGVSPSRDYFSARLERLSNELQIAGFSMADLALLVAVVGEIGNNTFDHNLGYWRDEPGCYFAFEIVNNSCVICLADRGRGILSSLSSVDPKLTSFQEALETAFKKVISGRAPEKRGNGLKFVRQVINGHEKRVLHCQSGDGVVEFGGNVKVLKEYNILFSSYKGLGVFMFINWML